MRSKLGKTTLFAVLLFAAACSGSLIAFFYNRIPSYTLSKLDKYFDLQRAQKEDARQKILLLQQWHRTEEIPRYVSLLQTAQSYLQDGLSATEYDQLAQKFILHRDAFTTKIIPVAAEFLSSLSASQKENLKQQWEKENAKEEKEAQKETSRPEEQKRYKRLVFAYRYLLGSLRQEQLDILDKASKSFSAQYKNLSLRFRRQRQQEMLRLLQSLENNSPASKAAVSEKLRQWFLPPEKSYPAYFQKADQEYMAAVKSLVLAIDRSLNTEQRQSLLQKLQSWRQTLRDLAAS